MPCLAATSANKKARPALHRNAVRAPHSTSRLLRSTDAKKPTLPPLNLGPRPEAGSSSASEKDGRKRRERTIRGSRCSGFLIEPTRLPPSETELVGAVGGIACRAILIARRLRVED